MIVPKEVKEFFEAHGLPIEILDVVTVFKFGAKKHGKDSWLNPDNPSMEDRSNNASLGRHLAEHMCKLSDPETGGDPLLNIIARASMKYTRKQRGIEDAEKSTLIDRSYS